MRPIVDLGLPSRARVPRRSDGDWHRSVHVWLTDETGSVLLRRRTSALRAFATKPDLTLVEDRDGIRTITMNNPAKYNGWTDPMLRSWMGRFADAATDDSVKALILTGSGKYYCAGSDDSPL